jgi:2-polyprenyl-3-methyl-5-hydroxy-6-metoxy-1,4-benzoquinol methylase
MTQKCSKGITPSTENKDDMAGRDYWDDAWADRSLVVPIDPRDLSLRNYVNLRLHSIFERILGTRREGLKLLEIGCAGSAWLPYFAREYGFEVTGIDYSEVGCQQAREVLERAGVTGNVLQNDMFDVPDFMKHAFDVVITFGVIEHFADTASCMRTLTSYCKPGGVVISVIPNLQGISGLLQKSMNKEVFSLHKVLSAEELNRYCFEAELQPILSEHLPFFNPGAANLGFTHPHTMVEFVKVCIRKALTAIAMCIWAAEKVTHPVAGNRFTSSSIVNISVFKVDSATTIT